MSASFSYVGEIRDEVVLQVDLGRMMSLARIQRMDKLSLEICYLH